MCSQALRVKMICSEETDFEHHIHEMRSWFHKRADCNKILDEELVKNRCSNQEKTCSQKGKGIWFTITHHSILQALNNITKRNLNWLYARSKIYFYLDPWFHFKVLGN